MGFRSGLGSIIRLNHHERVAVSRFLVISFLLVSYGSFAQNELETAVITDVLDSTVHAVPEQSAVQQMANTKETGHSDLAYPNFVAPSYEHGISTYTIERVPSPRGNGIFGYVSDPWDYISHDDELRINQLLYGLEKKATAEVAIVMLPSIGTEVPKDFAVGLFREWGIGKSDTNNGLLILTVMDQRRTEFETGYGLEPVLTDVICYRIGTQEMVPNFRQGDYGAGMVAAVERIKQFLEHPDSVAEIYSNEVQFESNADTNFLGVVIGVFLLVYGLICLITGILQYSRLQGIEHSKDDFYDKYHRLDKVSFGCLLLFLLPLPFVWLNRLAKKRLKKYRYAPRYSKVNGMPMTLKDEWAENAYLEVAQVLEEKLNSVRYDVWVTDDQSDVMVLEYEGPNGRKYDDCVACGYRTFGKKSSTVTKAPSYDYGGERVDYYECRNCNFQESKTVELDTIPRPTSSSSSSSSGSSYSASSSGSSSSSSFGGGSSGGGGAGVSW